MLSCTANRDLKQRTFDPCGKIIRSHIFAGIAFLPGAASCRPLSMLNPPGTGFQGRSSRNGSRGRSQLPDGAGCSAGVRGNSVRSGDRANLQGFSPPE
jgi:hypothetical protein